MGSNFHRNYHHRSSLEQRQYGGRGGENCSVPGPGLGGLSRYRSAPSSCFADVDFLCQPSSPDTVQILERFISGTDESTARAMESGNGGDGEAEVPTTMKRQETGAGFAEQRSYASPVSRDMGMEYMVAGGGTEATRVVPAKGGYVQGSLVRHSSSPAWLFDNINIDERHVSRLNGAMSPIHEIGKKNTVGVTTSTSCYLAGFPIGSFDDGQWSPGILFPDRQRGGNDDVDVFSGQIDEEEEVHRTRPLAHHLSLPRKSSADIKAMESFLQLQDSVPCKVRAKRGCATHPRSIAERVRRTKISERIRKLQDLVPNMDKQTNTADMLDLAVDYIKELQGQVKTLSDDRARSSRNSRMEDALSATQLLDGYVSYRWERRMQEMLSVPNSSCFLSMLFLRRSPDLGSSHYNDLEDTLTRANAWLNASQNSGVPISFINIQTEPLLTKILGVTASSTVNAGSLSDLSNLATASLYGFEDYHGVDIGVGIRAVRLWYAPLGGEHAVEIKLNDDQTMLGFTISRTEEGFVYILLVIDGDVNAPSTRSGLSKLHREATISSRLLVISRVSNQKVLPWIVSSPRAIRCYDTVSLSHKLSLLTFTPKSRSCCMSSCAVKFTSLSLLA